MPVPAATSPKLTHKAFSSDVSVVDGERAVMARISTISVDHDGEVLLPQGCNSKAYEKNPIVCWAHDSYWSTPVGRVDALKRDGDSVWAKIVFAERPATHPADEEWFPDTLLSLYQQRVLNAFSVGFKHLETRPATDRDVEKYGAGCRRVTTKWELLELSCVPLPCNSGAVAQAVSKGLLRKDVADAMELPPAPAEEAPAAEAPAADGAKADGGGEPKMAACKGCEKEFPVDELDDDGFCPDCGGDDDEMVPPTDGEPEKRVVAAIEGLKDAAPSAEVKRVHRVLPGDAPAAGPAVKSRTIVIRATEHVIAKMCGQIYPGR